MPCPDVLVQDFPTFVDRYGIELQGYFDHGRPAVIDEQHCVQLGYEAFFFADRAGRDRFVTNAVAYCGLLTDPVSNNWPNFPQIVVSAGVFTQSGSQADLQRLAHLRPLSGAKQTSNVRF